MLPNALNKFTHTHTHTLKSALSKTNKKPFKLFPEGGMVDDASVLL
jgi:hypothetical protein